MNWATIIIEVTNASELNITLELNKMEYLSCYDAEESRENG